MTDLKDKAWTCINRWERRGYETQVETFKAVMAENEKLREALWIISMGFCTDERVKSIADEALGVK
jgi:hypothetical protein